MINISTDRGKYIIRPPFYNLTDDNYYYNVYIGGDLIFTGRVESNTFGTGSDGISIDCADWIDAYISKSASLVTSVVLTVDLLDSTNTVVATRTYTWTPYLLSQTDPGETPPYMNLELWNCGFLYADNKVVNVPLLLNGDKLVGKTINKMEKTTYVDKYGDVHNASLTNHYEIECYIDPCWLHTTTDNDDDYERIMLALQGAKEVTMYGEEVRISGMQIDTLPDSESPDIVMGGRIKDIEKIETYSSYSVRKKVPTYKITFEVHR